MYVPKCVVSARFFNAVNLEPINFYSEGKQLLFKTFFFFEFYIIQFLINNLFFIEDRIEDWTSDVEERIQFGVDFGKRNGFIKPGNTIICITGWRKGAGSSNTIRIL